MPDIKSGKRQGSRGDIHVHLTVTRPRFWRIGRKLADYRSLLRPLMRIASDRPRLLVIRLHCGADENKVGRSCLDEDKSSSA